MLPLLKGSKTALRSGGGEPHANAFREPERTLFLHSSAPLFTKVNTVETHQLVVQKYLAPADAVDEYLVGYFRGTVLDIGCGPGRLVHAAILAGHLALGIDISTAAVAIAQDLGLPVLCRSVFQRLPSEGTWGTVVVLDGNIGIGGDPLALLQRCAELVTAGGQGQVLVEVNPESDRHRIYDGTTVDDRYRGSLPFPWAEVGAAALSEYAASAGLTQRAKWNCGRRTFVLYSL